MTLSENEPFSVRWFHFTVAGLSVLIIILILIGLLSHRPNPGKRAVWKSSPYGEVRDTANVTARH